MHRSGFSGQRIIGTSSCTILSFSVISICIWYIILILRYSGIVRESAGSLVASTVKEQLIGRQQDQITEYMTRNFIKWWKLLELIFFLPSITVCYGFSPMPFVEWRWGWQIVRNWRCGSSTPRCQRWTLPMLCSRKVTSNLILTLTTKF